MAAADYRLMTEATGQRIAAALEALSGFGAYLTTADVVNNLTSTETDKPLSANMGKALNTAIQQSTANLAVANEYSGNIDNMLKTGLYYLKGATGTGITNGAFGMLIVVSVDTRSVQIHADIFGDYVRFRRYTGSWSTWKNFTLS